MKRVIVLGAGVAGLSAALGLVDAGYDVTLVEARPHAGGRAFSYTDRISGEEIDNGQHVMMGCYAATLRYMERIGTGAMIRRLHGLSLAFRHANGESAQLQAGGLPGTLGMAQALLRFRLLSLRERMGIVRTMVSLRFIGSERATALHDVDCRTWLMALGQSERAMECFWTPVVLATLNTSPVKASAGYLLTVLRAIFFSGKAAADMLLPEVGLSELLVRSAEERLVECGARVVLHQPAECLEISGRNVIGVRMKGGETLFADAVVSAVAPWSLSRLLPQAPVLDTLRNTLQCFEPSPILSAHVWLARDPSLPVMTGALGTAVQWLFPKGRSADGSWRLSCTISASDTLQDKHPDDIRALLAHELPLLIQGLSFQDILRILPLHERRATFLPAAGIDRLRPLQRTEIPGLYLAGDWTATSLPATIEGAILSGEAAARAVQQDFSQMEQSA